MGTSTRLTPELVLVFDLAGSVQDFCNAINRVEGLEFLSEFLDEATEPDDDFHMVSQDGRTDDLVGHSSTTMAPPWARRHRRPRRQGGAGHVICNRTTSRPRRPGLDRRWRLRARVQARPGTRRGHRALVGRRPTRKVFRARSRTPNVKVRRARARQPMIDWFATRLVRRGHLAGAARRRPLVHANRRPVRSP